MPTGTESRGVSLCRTAAGMEAGSKHADKAKQRAKENRFCMFVEFCFSWLGDDRTGLYGKKKKSDRCNLFNGFYIIHIFNNF
jgi:hypothetical protein